MIYFKKLDITIILCIIIIFSIGLLFVYSSSSSLSPGMSKTLVTRQLIWFFFGICLIILILTIDYQKIIDLSFFLYGLNLILLIIVLFIGSRKLGAQRWLEFGGFGFQPSEFIKITFILALASYLGHRKDSIESRSNIFTPVILMLPAFFLIAAQPDLGTALMLLPILISMLFIAGINIKSIILFLSAGFLSMPLSWQLLKDYQKKRLLVFMNSNLDPLGAGYTIIQSKIAIGSGQLFGKGWLSGTQSQLNFLPERHTDFIFSVAGEEWGFIGSVILILLYFIVIYRGIRIIEQTRDFYGKTIAAGIVSLFSFQIIVNIGMTIGLLPVVGLTLPFISYGGSSLISSMIAIGILLNIGMRRPSF